MAHLLWFDYKKRASTRDIWQLSDDVDLSDKEERKKYDLAWFNYFLDTASQAPLLKKNTYMKDFLRKKVSLLHVTPSLNQIKKEGKLYPSGGGLGIAVYCAPVHEDNTVHNIAHIYYTHQMPFNLHRKPHILCINLYLKPQKTEVSEWGVDYTDFGQLQTKTWENLKNKELVQKKDSKAVEKTVVNMVNECRGSLSTLSYLEGNIPSLKEFKSAYSHVFTTLPSLRFILYELMAEYLLLYQNNEEANRFSQIGEVYNLNHKRFVWNLCPAMFKRFRMTEFFIDFDTIVSFLNRKTIVTDFEQKQFIAFFRARLQHYLRKILSSKPSKASDFIDLMKKNPHLVGHLVYRMFPDRRLFETERANLIQKEITQGRVCCPIYSIVPKGEVGINPCIAKSGIDYEVFVSRFNKKGSAIDLTEKLDIRISDNLISDRRMVTR